MHTDRHHSLTAYTVYTVQEYVYICNAMVCRHITCILPIKALAYSVSACTAACLCRIILECQALEVL